MGGQDEMTYFYLDASREGDPDALADVEVFESPCLECKENGCHTEPDFRGRPGWRFPTGCPECGCQLSVRTPVQLYWYAYGSPGCLWESDPIGPFDTEVEALKAAREAAGFCEHGVSDEAICEACPAPELWVLKRPIDGTYACRDKNGFLSHTVLQRIRGLHSSTTPKEKLTWANKESAFAFQRDHRSTLNGFVPVRLTDAEARRRGQEG